MQYITYIRSRKTVTIAMVMFISTLFGCNLGVETMHTEQEVGLPPNASKPTSKKEQENHLNYSGVTVIPQNISPFKSESFKTDDGKGYTVAY
jgi:hypothetical protein